jgi:hypothetical protein
VARYAHLSPAHLLGAVERLVEVSRFWPDRAAAEKAASVMVRYLPVRLTVPGWRNWKTRQTQNLVGASPWGFDSPSRHHYVMPAER